MSTVPASAADAGVDAGMGSPFLGRSSACHDQRKYLLHEGALAAASRSRAGSLQCHRADRRAYAASFGSRPNVRISADPVHVSDCGSAKRDSRAQSDQNAQAAEPDIDAGVDQ